MAYDDSHKVWQQIGGTAHRKPWGGQKAWELKQCDPIQSLHSVKNVQEQEWNSRRLVHSKEMVWALRWSVPLRTFYRQILSVLYSSFFSWNFCPRLARELLVWNNIINSSHFLASSISWSALPLKPGSLAAQDPQIYPKFLSHEHPMAPQRTQISAQTCPAPWRRSKKHGELFDELEDRWTRSCCLANQLSAISGCSYESAVSNHLCEKDWHWFQVAWHLHDAKHFAGYSHLPTNFIYFQPAGVICHQTLFQSTTSTWQRPFQKIPCFNDQNDSIFHQLWQPIQPNLDQFVPDSELCVDCCTVGQLSKKDEFPRCFGCGD